MQPTYAIRSSPISGGSGCLSAMSLTASRPPGFSTRAISRNTARLSGREVDHAVADHAVDRRVGQRQLVDRRLVKLDVRRRPPAPRSAAPARSSPASCRCRSPCPSARPSPPPGTHRARRRSPGRRRFRPAADWRTPSGLPHESPMFASAGIDASSLGRIAERLGHRPHARRASRRQPALAPPHPYFDRTASTICLETSLMLLRVRSMIGS